MSTYAGEKNVRLLRHGKGEYRYSNLAFSFNGQWKDGAKHGMGVFEVDGECSVEGTFEDGEIEGLGTKTWADGRQYEGGFERGEASGEGRFTSPSGEIYCGMWKKNKRHGYGQLSLPGGKGTYIGEFHNHRYHGNGRLVLASGFTYRGGFSQGLPHGRGSCTYPRGSSYRGPLNSGRRHGHGGHYTCGTTGIRHVGGWKADRVEVMPSRLVLEPDAASEEGVPSDSGPHDGKARSGARSGKAAKGAGGRVRRTEQSPGDTPGDNTRPLLPAASFTRDGSLAGIWIRCARGTHMVDEGQALKQTPEDGEGANSRGKHQTQEIVFAESGRTLAVTLHKILEASSPAIGNAVAFFQRRKTATDISEQLGRFPRNALVAQFERESRTFPRGSNKKLSIVHGTGGDVNMVASGASMASRAPMISGKTPDVDQLAAKGRGEEEVSDVAWQMIRGCLGSNGCLILRAGTGASLQTGALFRPGIGSTMGRGIANLTDVGSTSCIEEKDDESGAGGDTRALLTDHVGDEGLLVDRHLPYTVCLDFYVEVDTSAVREKHASIQAEQKVTEGEGAWSERSMRLFACGEHLECFVILRLQVPLPLSDPCLENEERVVGADTGAATRSSAEVPEPVGQKIAAAEPKNSGDHSGWYIHSLTIRSGSRVATAQCSSRSGGLPKLGENATPSSEGHSEGAMAVELETWHALAVVSGDELAALPGLFVDGVEFRLRWGGSSSLQGRCDSRAACEAGIVLGGPGREWTKLGVKNLALYGKALDAKQLMDTTGVYKSWILEQAVVEEEDKQHKELMVAKSGKSAAAGDSPELGPPGTDPVTSVRRATVHGEVRMNDIVLPQAVLEGGQWLLRVQDVSQSSQAAARGDVPPFSDTGDEREVFATLPELMVTLEPSE